MVKKWIHTVHLILGLSSGIVLFIVAITGCIVAFEEELKSVVYADYYEVKPTTSTSLSLEKVVDIAQKEYPTINVKNIHVKPLKTSSIEIVFQNDQTVFVNPYTGVVLGNMNEDEGFFGIALELHKNLCLGETGKTITAISALLFFILLISGIILWWPRKKTQLKQHLVIKRGVNWRKKNFDLHRVLGFYASWIILFTVLSGLVWAFDWAEDGLYWITNSKKQPRVEVESAVAQLKETQSIDAIYAHSISHFPTHKECILQFPENESGVFRVVFRYADNGFFRRIDNLYFDQYSGKMITKRLFSKLSTGDQIRISNINIHTGKALGLTGQLLVFFASLICASLPITGFLIWLGKRNLSKNTVRPENQPNP